MYADPNMYRQVRSRSDLVCGCQPALVNLFCFLCIVYQVQIVLLLLCFVCVFFVCVCVFVALSGHEPQLEHERSVGGREEGE